MPEIVLVTKREYDKAEALFLAAEPFEVRCVSSEEGPLAEAVLRTRCRAAIVGTTRYVGPLYEALGRSGGAGGALLARFGVGHDGIDKGLARRHNLCVTNTPGALDASVAEHAIWLLGALARRLWPAQAEFRAGRFAAPGGVELFGKTLGILGYGAIGRRVAAIAHFGLGMRVVAAGRRSQEHLCQPGATVDEAMRRLGLAAYTTDLESVLRDADAVSLHLPATDQTRHCIDARRLRLMKPDAMLINTARGSVLDEDALFDALSAEPTRRRPGGAALDVFQQEPYAPPTPGKDLRTLDNAVLTPHIGSNTHEANSRMAQMCLDDVRRFFAGRFAELHHIAGELCTTTTS